MRGPNNKYASTKRHMTTCGNRANGLKSNQEVRPILRQDPTVLVTGIRSESLPQPLGKVALIKNQPHAGGHGPGLRPTSRG